MLPVGIAGLTVIYLLCVTPTCFASDGVIINEVMADPISESRSEFIELYNAGQDTVDIEGWFLTDLKDQNDVLIDYTDVFDEGRSGTILYPGHYALIIDPDYDGWYNDVIMNHADPAMLIMVTIKGDRTLGNGLGNNGDSVILLNSDRRIDSFSWSTSAGGNGISWEKIRYSSADGETNRAPSKHISGSTPGFSNSVVPQLYHFIISPDTLGLIPVQPEIGQPSTIILGIENTGLMDIEGVRLQLQVQSHALSILNFNEDVTIPSGSSAFVNLTWIPNQSGNHRISISAEIDGVNGVLQDSIFHSVHVPFPPFSLMISEIMFNPGSNRSEWIEIYNPQDYPVDIESWGLSKGMENDIKIIKKSMCQIPARSYIILTQDSLQFMIAYPLYPGIVIQPVGGWHRLNNTGDLVSLVDLTGRQVHTIKYESDWSPEAGRSAERVHLEPGDGAVWGPSASRSGGTPGTRNSLFLENIPSKHHLDIQPNPFSPDHDGKQDACIITLSISQAHGVLYAVMFDFKGRSVKILANQIPIANSHTLIWTGKDDRGNTLPPGPYVLYTEALMPDGRQVITSKRVIVIAPP